MENSKMVEQQMYQFRILKEQRDMLAQQLEILSASQSNLLNTKTTLENLKNIKEGEEILVPIGGMVNIKATIKEPERILLYISQDVVIEKNLDDSIDFINNLIEQHKKQIDYLITQIQNLDLNLQGMSQVLQESLYQK